MKFKRTQVIIIAIIIFIIASVSVLWHLNSESRIERFSTVGKCAIAVLTKGYQTKGEYDTLIRRNISIYDLLYKHNPQLYDVVIFHEGNITNEHQKYIQDATDKMPLQFISIKFKNNVQYNESLCPPTKLSESFSIGYKNMCWFWSLGFLEDLAQYDYIIRIDEDCILRKIDPNIIDSYKRKGVQYSSPFFQGPDDADVTVGMESFFKSILKETNITPKSEVLRCPYTNVFIMNVQYFRNDLFLKTILKKLDESNCIWSNRWGDLPIWGYILTYFYDPTIYLEDKSIQYTHGSHNASINF